MHNRKKPDLKSLLQKKADIEKKANRIIQRQPPSNWPIRDIKEPGIEHLINPTYEMIMAGGLPGHMYGAICGALIADSCAVSMTPAAVLCSLIGFFAGYKCMEKAPCSPFDDCNRLRELHQKFNEARLEIKKLSPIMKR